MVKREAYNNMLEDTPLMYDVMSYFMGKFIGNGYSRYVFEYQLNKKYVVKIDHNTRGSNFMEWEIWNTVKGTKFEKWFAPCLAISQDGKVLIQRKAKELTWYNRWKCPKKVPTFFKDVRKDNWGIVDGKCVCIDYALTSLLKIGLINEMKPVDWHLIKYSVTGA